MTGAEWRGFSQNLSHFPNVIPNSVFYWVGIFYVRTFASEIKNAARRVGGCKKKETRYGEYSGIYEQEGLQGGGATWSAERAG